MTSAVPAAGALAWAQQLLSGDATLAGLAPAGVYLGALPPPPPGTAQQVGVVLNEPTPAQDRNTLYGNPWASDVDLQVTVFGPASGMTAMFTAAARVYTLLQRASGGAQGTVVLACIRQTNRLLPQPELVNGVQQLGIYQGFQVIAQ